MEKLKVLDLFCGIGGMSKGFKDAGCEVIEAVDVKKQKLALYKQLFTNIKACDIQEMDYKNLSNVDIIASKLPTMSFSTAGARKGSSVKNYSPVLEIIKVKMPRAFLIEAVPLFPSLNNGDDMNELLEQFRQYGYNLVWDLIESKNFSGFSVGEKRTYIVGIREDIYENEFEIPKPIFLEYSISGILDKNIDEWYRNISLPEEQEFITGRLYSLMRGEIREFDFIPMGAKENYICDEKGLRKFTHNELAKLKGLPLFNYNDCMGRNNMYRNIILSSNAFVIRAIGEKIIKYLEAGNISVSNKMPITEAKTKVTKALTEEKKREVEHPIISEDKDMQKFLDMKGARSSGKERVPFKFPSNQSDLLCLVDKLEEISNKELIEDILVHKDEWQILIEKVDSTKLTNQERGKALEELMYKFFCEIEGFSCDANVRNSNEELDIVITNNSKNFSKESPFIICECKNWKDPVPPKEVSVLLDKMKKKNGRCNLGFLVAWNGVTSGVDSEIKGLSRTDLAIVVLSKDGILNSIQEKNIKDFVYNEYFKTVFN